MSRSTSPAPSSSTDATAYPFTCLVCGIAFSISEQQRTHHSSDWHKYNLKRKMNGLASVGAQEFQQKVEQKKKSTTTNNIVTELVYACQPCAKQYSSENAFQVHTRSKKHMDKVNGEVVQPEITEKKKRTIKVESLEDKKKIKVDINECIFCPNKFETVELVIDHIIADHGFFFPDIEYLVDIRGLLLYLGHKVKVGYGCVWCHGLDDHEKGLFHSVSNVQQHMADMGHCKIKFEDAQWNEYSSFYDFTTMEEPVLVELDPSTRELVLNGKKMGHRSWHKYYKQHYSNIQDVTVRDAHRQGEAKPHEKHRRDDWRLKVGVKANSQKHFREQIL